MTGRPSKYTEAIGDEICERLADGESLRHICAGDDMPSRSAVFRWLGENEAFRNQYARSREEQAEALADEIIEIADGKRGTEDEPADVKRDRLSVDARKWVAAKLKPKVYGDKQLIGSDPENPLPEGFSVQLVKAKEK